MKIIILAVSCLLCVMAVGGELHAQKIESITSQNDADLSTSEEQTEVPADITLSELVQLDNLRAIGPHSLIAEQQVLSLVASASLDEIIEAVANMPNNNYQTREYEWVIRPITQRWIELDPDGALLEIIKVVRPQDVMHENMASDLLIENYARMQPESLIEQVGSIPLKASRPDKLLDVYFYLGESAPDLAMDLLTRNHSLSSDEFNSLSSDEFNRAEIVFRSWSENDPQAALQWLEQNGDKPLLDKHVESLISRLASRDPEAAKIAAAIFPGLFSEDEFVIQDIRILTETDPVAAMKMAQSLPEGNDRDDTVNSILSSLSSQSPAKRQELLDWSESLSPKSQMGVREVVVSEWARSDPEAAIEWLNKNGGLSNYYHLANTIAWNLPQRNMDMALDFYSSVYSSLDHESLVEFSKRIACTLHENNPQSAWRWYEGLPKNDARQSVLFELVMTTARENPHEALDIVYSANSGDNVEMTISVIEIIADEYDFPEQAENWLASANIDEQHAKQIRAAMAQLQQDRNSVRNLPIHRGC